MSVSVVSLSRAKPYLNAFKNLNLLIISQLGEIFLDGYLCSGWVETWKQRRE